MQLKAYAKLNWCLNIVRKRDDGYHELDTIMQRVSLYDDVFIEDAPGLSIACPEVEPMYNTAHKAAKLYFERAKIPPRAHISIHKRIPIEAGLGGSSTDAAAVLRGLNSRFALLAEADLYALAVNIGADVPFCLLGSSARCMGIGEILCPQTLPSHTVLLVKPQKGLSTAELFAAVSARPITHPPVERVLNAIKMRSQSGPASGALNSFIPVAVRILPQIKAIIERLMDCGAGYASMSGSGSCCFGVFKSRQEAHNAAANFADMPFVMVCQTLGDN